ncbi:MAG: AbrB family transcriptional regulator, partial [Treponema sp.]|nr:AbrB family transcriptional regulator [Treponema sp.]
PAVILVAMLAAFNILFAFIISRLSAFDVITALFATAPGGVADIALIAADFGADTQQVAVLQIFRFVLVVLLFPPIVRKIIKTNPQLQSDFPAPNESGVPKVSAKKQAPRKQILKIIATLCTASAGAALARLAGIPAGALIGSLTATIALGTIVQAAYLPKWTRRAVQIFAGCFIGSKITLATLAYFQHLLVPMALIVVQLLAMTFGTAYMLRRFGSMDRATSLFSSIPGGFAEMTLIAQEMGLRVPEIVFLNTCRIISVVALMPVLLFLFTKFL